MKKILFFALFLQSILGFSQNFGEFKMLPKGVIEYNSRYFQTEFAGDYQQSTLVAPKITSTSRSYSLVGDFIVKRKDSSVAVDMGGTAIQGGAVSASKPAPG